MSLDKIVEIIHSGNVQDWYKRNEVALKGLFGSPQGRYPANAEKAVKLRAPEMSFESSGIPFAAYIHPNNPNSGPYSGFSFVLFPAQDQPALVGLVIGTQGLAPDENILGRPGHARKAQAICAWLNREFGKGDQVAWAKQDPTRRDFTVPENITRSWSAFHGAFQTYGPEIYAAYRPNSDRKATSEALTAFLDLMFEERGYLPNKPHLENRDQICAKWFDHLMPRVERTEVKDLLSERHFVVIQGPPGTGKTRMAGELLSEDYGGIGCTIQFHPNTTYENLIGGLAPEISQQAFGLQFRPKPGFLMQAAADAEKIRPKPFLLHIDEINRADLSKILGEAIYLLEPREVAKRRIELPYDFGEPFHNTFQMPDNLHVIGTMNSADRSIAIVDVAIRRRFAFVSLWPQMSVVDRADASLCKTPFAA